MTYQIKTNRALCSGLGDDKISIVLDAEAGDDETVLDGPPEMKSAARWAALASSLGAAEV